MADPATQPDAAALELLFQLHGRLLEAARAELLDAVGPISEVLGQLLEQREQPLRAALEQAAIDLQAADSVAQRLAHLQSAMDRLDRLARADQLHAPSKARAQLFEQLWRSFTIADERATFAEVLAPGEESSSNLRPPGGHGDLELF
ncbi:MAG: hypothetical protein AAGG11_00650 [Pseudomonadota bacterium]